MNLKGPIVMVQELRMITQDILCSFKGLYVLCLGSGLSDNAFVISVGSLPCKCLNPRVSENAGRTSAGKTSKSGQQGKEHSGKRFAASKKGAGGDVKGKSKVEPYAYWPLDRKMLNRRTAKKSEATQGLTDIVSTSGNKWKNKKQRR